MTVNAHLYQIENRCLERKIKCAKFPEKKILRQIYVRVFKQCGVGDLFSFTQTSERESDREIA